MCQLISCPQCTECWPETLAVCVDDLITQYPWDAPIKRSQKGLSSGIVETTISLKCGVQETQIPSKLWVSWLFEHPVQMVARETGLGTLQPWPVVRYYLKLRNITRSFTWDTRAAGWKSNPEPPNTKQSCVYDRVTCDLCRNKISFTV
jgi:hypothetical protein